MSIAATLVPAFMTTLLLAGAALLPAALAALSVRTLFAARIPVGTGLLRTVAGWRAPAGIT